MLFSNYFNSQFLVLVKKEEKIQVIAIIKFRTIIIIFKKEESSEVMILF